MKQKLLCTRVARMAMMLFVALFATASAWATGGTLTGSGTSSNPYLISDVSDWNTFANNVNAGTNADKYYKLAANIGSSSDPITSMVGSRNGSSDLYPFSGHFDGDGKTLYVNIGGSEGAAPFCFIDGATIENVTVQGAVTCNLTDNNNHAGGLVGTCGSNGSILIKNCIVDANVSFSKYGGGIVGHAGHGNMTLQDCVFKGSINNFTNYAGGLIGWCDALTLTITNCFFVGSFSPGSGGLYHPMGCCNKTSDVTSTITNAYCLHTITATAGSGKILPNADGTRISSTRENGTWDTRITAPDGTYYYGAHVDGGNTGSTELTVYEGTTTNQNVPMYVFYFDDFTRSQFVIPSDSLMEMSGGTISSIKYYTKSNNIPYTTMSEFDIYMTEVPETTLSAYVDKSSADIVYHGTGEFVSANGGGEITITFTTPYTYNGGNLVIGCDNITDAEYKSIFFYGQTVNGASISGSNGSSLDNVSTNQRNFIPKTTFTYIPSGGPSAPTSLEATNVTYNSATLTWDGGSDKYNVEYKATTDADWTRFLTNTTNTTCTLTGLNEETSYQARVQSVDTDNSLFSGWRTTTFTTPIKFEIPTGLTATLTPMDGTVATLTWTENGTATQWQLQYGTDTAFEAGTYTETTASDTPSKALTGLIPETIYYARVRAVYEGEGESQWSDVIKFNPTNKVIIGSGTNTSILLPSYSYAKYELSQQIYTADEIGMAGTLTSIDFYNAGTEQTRNYDIYLVHTDKESFSNNYNWITVTADDKVFSGNVTMVSNEWTTITFDTPFAYDGSNNLALVVDDNTGTGVSGMSCRVFTPAITNESMYAFSSGDTNYDPTNPPSSGSNTSNKNQIRLGITPFAVQPLYKPQNVTCTLTPGNGTIATISWRERGTATQWTLQYGTDEAFGEGSYIETSVSGTPSKALTGLTPETAYYVRVKSIDGTDESVWSNIVAFTPTNDYTLTVHDGTTKNPSVPIYGFYCENFLKCEFVMPANELSAMVGGTITAMTFYLSTPATGTWGDANFQVFMKEVNDATIGAFSGTDNATIVYEGPLDGTQSTMTIEFTTPYTYGGGNLLIGVYNTVKGTWKQCYFYGETVSGASVYGRNANSIDNVTATTEDFLPKTTFDFAPSGAPDMPTSLATTTVTYNSATLTWEGSSGNYNVEYKEKDSDSWTRAASNISTTNYTIQGLSEETEYQVRVQSVNATDNSLVSSWRTTTFTTPIRYQKPTDMAATLTVGDGTVATLTWTENGTATQWQLQYGTDELFSAGTYTETTASETTKSLTGLTPETTYYARVRSVYEGEGESQWSSVFSFTPTDAYCITVNDGTTQNERVPIYGYWVDNLTKSQFIIEAADLSDIIGADINKMTFYLSQSSINLGNSTFDIYLGEVNETAFESATLVDWETLENVYSGSVTISDNKMEITFDVPYQYLGENLLVGFNQTTKSGGAYPTTSWYGVEATGAAVAGYNTTLNIQNFRPKTTFDFILGTAPSCPKPTSVTISDISDVSAVVSWTSEASAWNLRYREVGATEWKDTIVVTTSPTCTITGLDAYTEYEVQVQTNCGDGNYSGWTKEKTFTTALCSLANQGTISYKLIDSYGDGWNSAFVRVVHHNSGIVVAELTAENHGGGNTQSTDEGTLDLCCGEDFDFIWVNGSFDKECSFFFYDINGEEILSHESNGTTKPTAGTLISYTMDCTATSWRKPTNLEAITIYGTGAELSWTENGSATAWVVGYKAEGDEEFTEVDAPSNPFTLTGLTPETEYTVKVRPANNEGIIKWSSPITFTTDVAILAPMDLAVSKIGPHSAEVSWKSLSPNLIVEYVKGFGDYDCFYGNITPLGDIGNNGNPFSWGVMFPAGSHCGNVLTHVYVYDHEAMDATLTIYNDGDTAPSSQIASKNVTFEGAGSYMDIELDDVTFDPTKNVWVVFTGTAHAALSTNVFGMANGRWVNAGEGWEDITQYKSDYSNGAWMIEAHFDGNSSVAWTSVEATSPYTLTGLDEESLYTVRVKALYEGNNESEWTTIRFTTTDENPVPYDIEVATTATTATLTWTGFSDYYVVKYKKITDNIISTTFSDDFENGTGQWTVERRGEGCDETDWRQYDPTEMETYFTAHGGTYVASSRSWWDNVSYNADNWFITPKIPLDGWLTFWAFDDGKYHEYYEIMASTDDGNSYDTIYYPGDASRKWIKHYVDLSSYSGAEGNIVFHLQDFDKNFLLIDDVFVGNIEAPVTYEHLTSEPSVTLTGLMPDSQYEFQIIGYKEGMSNVETEIDYFRTVTPERGDVNGDGVVDTADVDTLVDIVLGRITEYNLSVADITDDGSVTIADVTALVNLILAP